MRRFFLLLLLSVSMLFPALPGYTDAPAVQDQPDSQALADMPPVAEIPTFTTGADPVTGRNGQTDLSWEQLCLTTWYELQIAKDRDFTHRINPAVNYGTGGFGTISAATGSILVRMDEFNMTNPAAWLAPGTLPEAGATYYWRIRAARSATGQWADSPWSEPYAFTIKPGFMVSTPYSGMQLLSPTNGCVGCSVSNASFTWSAWQDATKYEFVLSKDPEFKQIVVSATTWTTAYSYNDTLEYGTNYFWRVRAVEINGQAIPSDWSATFSYRTEAEPALPTPSTAAQETPLWVLVVIGIGVILVIVTIILAVRARK